MSEDKGELAKDSSSDTPPDDITTLSGIEERLVKATSPQDVVL